MGPFRSPILQEPWSNRMPVDAQAMAKCAETPGAPSECLQRSHFTLCLKLTDKFEIFVPMNWIFLGIFDGRAPRGTKPAGGVASNSAHQTGNCDCRNGTLS